MSSELERNDIDFSRGDEDVAFVHTDIDMEEISDTEEPRQELLEEMEKKGLEVENAHVIGIFRDEFSLLLQEDARIFLDGDEVYPGD